METLLLLYATLLGIALAFVVLLVRRNDESMSRKYAKIRVRVDDSRRGRMPEPPEDDFESSPPLELLIFGSTLLLILMLIASIGTA